MSIGLVKLLKTYFENHLSQGYYYKIRFSIIYFLEKESVT